MDNVIDFLEYLYSKKIVKLTFADGMLRKSIPPERIGFATIALANPATRNITYFGEKRYG